PSPQTAHAALAAPLACAPASPLEQQSRGGGRGRAVFARRRRLASAQSVGSRLDRLVGGPGAPRCARAMLAADGARAWRTRAGLAAGSCRDLAGRSAWRTLERSDQMVARGAARAGGSAGAVTHRRRQRRASGFLTAWDQWIMLRAPADAVQARVLPQALLVLLRPDGRACRRSRLDQGARQMRRAARRHPAQSFDYRHGQ